jgi:hypothetical protein
MLMCIFHLTLVRVNNPICLFPPADPIMPFLSLTGMSGSVEHWLQTDICHVSGRSSFGIRDEIFLVWFYVQWRIPFNSHNSEWLKYCSAVLHSPSDIIDSRFHPVKWYSMFIGHCLIWVGIDMNSEWVVKCYSFSRWLAVKWYSEIMGHSFYTWELTQGVIGLWMN